MRWFSVGWIVLMALVSAPTSGRCASTTEDLNTVAQWVTGLQYTDPAQPAYGALKIHPTVAAIALDGKQYYRVSPYVSNLGVLGLLRSHAPGSLVTAERWITWYLRHLTPESAPDGVPFEHFYLAGGTGETVCVKPNDPHLCRYNDATDSAAATFFLVLQAYSKAGGRFSFLKGDGQTQIEHLADILLALQNPDGLFWAKRDYRVKYLEDNCEVYAGLAALSHLEETVFKNRGRMKTCAAAAERVQRAIETDLYDPAMHAYRVAKFENGDYARADLNVWYPDMQAQLWPILFGVVLPSAQRARAALGALDEHWNGQERPDWASAPEKVNHGHINMDMAYAALLAGDAKQVSAYWPAARRFVFPHPPDSAGFAWPFSVGEAGWMLTLLRHLPVVRSGVAERSKPHYPSDARLR